MSTLEYAMRAKQIKNHPEANAEVSRTGLLKVCLFATYFYNVVFTVIMYFVCCWLQEYSNQMEALRRDLAAAREKNGIVLAKENYECVCLH